MPADGKSQLLDEDLDILAAKIYDVAAPVGDAKAFRVRSRKWLQEVDKKVDLSQLPYFAISAGGSEDSNPQADQAIAASRDANPTADRANPARLKSLRDAITSQLHVRNSAHLEKTLKSLDRSTKLLTVVLVLLAVVQVILATLALPH